MSVEECFRCGTLFVNRKRSKPLLLACPLEDCQKAARKARRLRQPSQNGPFAGGASPSRPISYRHCVNCGQLFTSRKPAAAHIRNPYCYDDACQRAKNRDKQRALVARHRELNPGTSLYTKYRDPEKDRANAIRRKALERGARTDCGALHSP